jgi:hypothetical protein
LPHKANNRYLLLCHRMNRSSHHRGVGAERVSRVHPNPGTMAGFANLRSLLYSVVQSSTLRRSCLDTGHVGHKVHAVFDNIDSPRPRLVPRERDCAHREGRRRFLAGASICSGNFSMLRMLVAAGFLRGVLALPFMGTSHTLSGKRESWHHPSVLFSDIASIECYRSSPSRARRHQAARSVRLRPTW